MVHHALKAYKAVSVQTTVHKHEILFRLLDGALLYLDLAREGAVQNNPQRRGENISKVLAIITELDSALDGDRAPELVENLRTLYQTLIWQLTHANLRNDAAKIAGVQSVLRTLRQAFHEAKAMVDAETRCRPEQREEAPAVQCGGKGVSLAI